VTDGTSSGPELTKETDVYSFALLSLEVSRHVSNSVSQLERIQICADLRLITVSNITSASQIITGKAPYYYVTMDLVLHLAQDERPHRERYPSPGLTDALWMLFCDCWAQQAPSRPDMGNVVERLHSLVNPCLCHSFHYQSLFNELCTASSPQSGPVPGSTYYRLPPPPLPRPPRHTVADLAADMWSALD
jgi:hypothetical protein